jgi:dTDP-3-amino-3,4,6-trideoxy-alpha-D-glucose transaminase
VPLLDLGALHAELREELDEAALRVLRSERVLLGPELAAFESAWATFVGARSAVGVNSGLDALSLGLRALGVRPGDEVVVPAHTFIATWLAVVHIGAVPVPVDACPEGLWDADAVEAAIGPLTRAILPVHLYGHPVDLDPILALADQHGLVVMDDAAQAHGARYHGRPVGGLTHATAWSFYPGKNLGALGDGGAVTTSDADVERRLRSLRNYGSTAKYVHDEIGWNSRLDELQAAALAVKLRMLTTHNSRRAAAARRYDDAFRGTDITPPNTAPWATHAWHLYVVRTAHRDALRAHLSMRGVETGVHYPIPPHHQGAFADTPAGKAHLPVAEALAREVLSLPMGPHLDEEAQAHVIDSVRSFRP